MRFWSPSLLLALIACFHSARAAEPVPPQIWNPEGPPPAVKTIPTVPGVEYRIVHAQTPDHQFLHEPRIAHHKGTLFVNFSNAPLRESEPAQIMRGRRSKDGGRTWSEVETVAGRLPDDERYETAPLLSHNSTLTALVGRYALGSRSSLGMELHALNESTDRFERVTEDMVLPGFIPFVAPQRLSNGNWIVGGHCEKVHHSAVAISEGDDLTKWQLVKIETPEGVSYPETALWVHDSRVVAICRNRGTRPALVSVSDDFGQTFPPAAESNMPMGNSKPFAGTLSTGQNYLIYNAPLKSRNTLLLAVGRPGEMHLSRVWRLIEGTPESIRPTLEKLDEVKSSQAWAYPEAVEVDGTLYVVFSHNKHHCWMATVPVSELAVE